jgi:hypothetical protein
MGMTWGQWQGATATSRAVSIGGPVRPATDFHVSLDWLTPSEVYSIFYATFGLDSVNPLCPNAERLLPVPSMFNNQQPTRPHSSPMSRGRLISTDGWKGTSLTRNKCSCRSSITSMGIPISARTLRRRPRFTKTISCEVNGDGRSALRQLGPGCNKPTVHRCESQQDPNLRRRRCTVTCAFTSSACAPGSA